jgi:hypothetical protein
MRVFRFVGIALLALSGLFSHALQAQDFGNQQTGNHPFVFPFRQPLGIYARDTSLCTPTGNQTTEQCLSAKAMALVSNPAVSGLNPEVGWSDLNPSFGAYDWTELEVVFGAVEAWNRANPNKPRKTVQIDVNPGFNTPQWVFDNMSSCDPMFAAQPEPDPTDNTKLNSKYVPYDPPRPGLVPKDCGYVTFLEAEHHNNPPYLPLPLPWNPYYKFAWATFVQALAEKYASNPDLVSVTMAGPTASSSEMILPSETSDAYDFYKWNYLLALTFPPSYQNSDRAFIEAWYDAIDLYSEAFSGLTLVITTGSGLPNFLMPTAPIGTANSTGSPFPNYSIPPGFEPACGSMNLTKIMDCAAEESVVAYFADPLHGGFNLKSSQENGLGAGGVHDDPLGGGDLDAWGIKWLAETSEQGVTRLPGSNAYISKFFGGLQSGGDLTGSSKDLLSNGCNLTAGLGGCLTANPNPSYPQDNLPYPGGRAQGRYNFLAAFFDGTKAGGYYGPGITGGVYGAGVVPGLIPMNYLQMYDVDIEYANANACDIPGGSCTVQTVINGAGETKSMTFQEVLEIAAKQFRQTADPTVPR